MGLTREEALKIMGLEEDCTTKEIRERFKKLALRWHPDKNIDNPEEAQKKFQAISAAYTKLLAEEEEDDDIHTDSLREMFAEIWRQSQNRGFFSNDPHLFCDCDACLADWEDLSLDDFLYSDSDPEEDFYYDDCTYADDLLRRFGDKLYRKFNEPVRTERRTKQMWTGAGYRDHVTAEEASKNAEELLRAEEQEKKAAEKKKKRNRKKKESKKRRKAKPQEDGCVEETPPGETPLGETPPGETSPGETPPGETPPGETPPGEEFEAEEVQEKVEQCETAAEEDRVEEEETTTYKQETGTVQQDEVVEEEKSGECTDKMADVRPPSEEVVDGSGVRDGVEEDGEEEDDDDSLPSEDELDFSSAFVSHAKLAAARAPSKTKKKPSMTEEEEEEQEEPVKKKTTNKEHKTDTRADSGHSEQKYPRNKPWSRQKPQSRYTRTANRGPSHSKATVVAGINGSAPVNSASNGYEASEAAFMEDEEDDLSPIDMSQAKLYEANIPQSKLLAGEGNRAAKNGEFEEAVLKYSKAISLYPFDHRYFGNRSFCYDYLQEYTKALADANSALKIEADWAKGYYRRGRGLAGLKRYEAAVAAFARALDLNPEYVEAKEQLDLVQLKQLQGMGFPLEASRAALAEYHTVPAAVDAMINRTEGGGGGAGGRGKKQRAEYTPVFNHSGFEIPPRMLPQTAPPRNCSLWVGNINSRSLTQSVLYNLFQKHGQVLSVRVLYERRCAFINYARAESAAAALKKLQGHTIGECSLLLRYPENLVKPNTQPSYSAPRSKRGKPGPVEEECHYWRTTGCSFGDNCRYLHLPESRGVDSGYYGDGPSQ